MVAYAGRALARDLVVLGLLVALIAGGLAWRRAAATPGEWRPVTLAAEGLRFRLPPGWRTTPLGYADPTFDPRRPGASMLLAVRSFAIPPEMRGAADGARPERVAVEAWAEAQRSGPPQGQRLLTERPVWLDGARGALLAFEDRRDVMPFAVVAAAAHDGRLYSFQAQAGPGADPEEAARALRRILDTVEWIPRVPGPVGQADRPPSRSGALQR